MAHLIDKSALAAEIEKLESRFQNGSDEDYADGYHYSLKLVKGILDSLEVKEVQEEPVSEDLGDYINELSKQFPEVSFAKLSRIAVRVAKWQKAKMMTKAIDGKVIANGMGNPILHLWDKGRHLIGKKVKVIVIKED